MLRRISSQELAKPGKRNKVVLAHFSNFKLGRTILLLGLILLLVVWIVFVSGNGEFLGEVRRQGGIWFPMLLFCLCGVVYAGWLELLFLRQALLDGGNALWIERGRLVYLNALYISRACEKITAVRIGTYGRSNRSAIFLKMRDGEEKLIPAGAFAEKKEDVVAALSQFIAHQSS